MSEVRPRNTTRQREAGAASRAETRRRLVEAAGAEFAEAGYVAATVARIAVRAGVTVQTLYLAWGSKRALLRAYVETCVGGEPGSLRPEEPRRVAAQLDALLTEDPQQILRTIVRLYRQIAERSALGWQLYRDAAAVDPEVAEDWQALQLLRRGTFEQLLDRLPTRSLRAHLTPATAIDTAWAIASPETYDLMVRRAGYSIDAYEEWVATTLIAALLPG